MRRFSWLVPMVAGACGLDNSSEVAQQTVPSASSAVFRASCPDYEAELADYDATIEVEAECGCALETDLSTVCGIDSEWQIVPHSQFE